jgi:hypothetical protein
MGDPAGFLQGGGRDEAALTDLLLLCCLLYFQLFLICIVGGNRFPHHSRQLTSSETSRLSLHRHDANTATGGLDASLDRPGIRPGNRLILRTNSLISADWQGAAQNKR